MQESLDDLIPLTAVPALLPRRRAGRKTSISTVYRWTSGGCRGVRLRYVQIGSTRCTTREWLDAFFAALTALAEGEAPAEADGTGRSPTRRARDLARAEREAEALGV